MPNGLIGTLGSPACNLFLVALACGLAIPSAVARELDEELAALAAQNAALLQLAREQQQQIAELRARLERMESDSERQVAAIEEIRGAVADIEEIEPRRDVGSRVHFSGDAGLAFFAGERNAQFANEEFRIDDARLNIEAEIAKGVYFVSTLELFRRESGNDAVELGPVFVDFEEVLGVAGYDRLFNMRIGRFDTPFGHEYMNRYVMENPLISHSVADLWGIDEGIGLYGAADRFSYAVAVQNGGSSLLRDFGGDKSVAGRIDFDVTSDLRVSASSMRTGDIDTVGDRRSEMWIGNVRFFSIGSPQTTRFKADLAQIDLSWRWRSGEFSGAYGEAWYRHNDPLGDNGRNFEFFHLEVRQNVTESLYGAARYSVMTVAGGYPFTGNGSRAQYLFGGIDTERLERLSLGLGYWAREDVLFKFEYSFEDGKHTDGSTRDASDQLAAELGVRF